MAGHHCEFPPNSDAERLVDDYLEAVLRAARNRQPQYPHDDLEHIFVGALYRAAWTWRPDGGAGFWHWFLRKAKGAMSTLQKRARRWSRGLVDRGRPFKDGRARHRGPAIRVTSLSAAHVDSRYYY